MSAGVTCPVCDRETPVRVDTSPGAEGGRFVSRVVPHGHVTEPDPCPGSGARVLAGSLSAVLGELARDAANGSLPGEHDPETCEQVLAGVRELFGALAVGVAVGDFHVPGHVFGDLHDLVRDLGYVLGEVTV